MHSSAVAPLPIVLPLLMAAALIIIERVAERRWLLDLLSTATAAAVTGLAAMLFIQAGEGTIVYWFGGWSPAGGSAIGISLAIDRTGAALCLLVAILTLLALIFSWHFFEAIGPFFHSLMLLFMASMSGFALTGDLFNMFVFFELMGVAAYALTAYKVEDTGPLEGALNFSVMNSVGAITILAGIAFLYARTGALNMAQAGRVLSGHPADPLVLMSFVLLAIGLMVKAAAVPFHFWLPDAHAVAPTPVSVLFSGIMVELALYGIARIYWTVYSGSFAGHEGQIRMLLALTGAVTCLLGGFMCFCQRHLKRMLAFSTVSHTGIILSGFAMLDTRAAAGATVYILGHGFLKGALFMCIGLLLHEFRSVDEVWLHGKATRLRIPAAAFLAGGLALAGLPPFGPFLGKSLMEESFAASGYGWLAYAAIAGSVLTGGAVLRAGAGVFLGIGQPSAIWSSAPGWHRLEQVETLKTVWVPFVMLGPVVVMLLLCLALGAFPGTSATFTSAAERFTDAGAYQSAVLDGLVNEPAARITELSSSGTVKGIASAAAAMLLAAATLQGYRLGPGVRSAAWKAFSPGLSLLRRMHSGLLRDYAMWFMAGAAAMAAAFFLSFS